MGLFFGRKKKPSGVPRPLRAPAGDQLNFPRKGSSETIITPKPAQFKKAAGVDLPFDELDLGMPKRSAPPMPKRVAKPVFGDSGTFDLGGEALPPLNLSDLHEGSSAKQPVASSHFAPSEPGFAPVEMQGVGGPVFIDVERYKEVLGDIGECKGELSHLSETSRKLEKAEFNEERSFSDLRSSMKALHDKLLSVDEILFKPQR